MDVARLHSSGIPFSADGWDSWDSHQNAKYEPIGSHVTYSRRSQQPSGIAFLYHQNAFPRIAWTL